MDPENIKEYAWFWKKLKNMHGSGKNRRICTDLERICSSELFPRICSLVSLNMLLLSFIRICNAAHRIAQICILNLSAFACFLFWKLTIEIGWEVLKVKFCFWNVLVWQAQTNQLDLPPLEGIIVHLIRRFIFSHFALLSQCAAVVVWWTPESLSRQAPGGKKIGFFF